TKYQNKKVFLTGHTGFKGAWMLVVLRYLGADVRGYSLEAEDPSLYNKINGDDLCQSVIGDINDLQNLTGELKDYQPDFVFHLAAQSIVRRSYKQPIETFQTNIIGTAHLLEAVRSLDGKCDVVVITTDKVYENLEIDYEYKEHDKLGGFDPYSSSKAGAEIVAASYRQSFFNTDDHDKHLKALATARSGNVIGGGDYCEDRIVPDIIRALEAGNPVAVRNPAAIRPWQHVLEPLGGYLLLGAKLSEDPKQFGTSYNFGPSMGDDLSVEALVKIALARWGSGDYEKPDSSGEPHEAGLLQLDIAKAMLELDWHPKLNSEEAIERTVDWYKNAEADPLGYCEQQIQSYFG
ncbi:MAG: CDP-glucose 4,6-dehydratase, partial [Flavobacteriales bacterium]|nr:CDP-glucose 4,6-dehydratase [Flavobacteriales bacterium]